MNRTELIEAMAQAIFAADGLCHNDDERMFAPVKWSELDDDEYPVVRAGYRQKATAALAALEAQIPGLADLIDGKAVVMPVEATTEMNTAHRLARMNVEGGYYDGLSAYAAMIAASPYKDAKP